MMDRGLPLPVQAGLLELIGDAIDIAKIGMGIAAIFTKQVLRQKIALYRKHDVRVHPAKMLLEYSANRHLEEQFFRSCIDLGFDMVEIADEVWERAPATKNRLMALASRFGLRFIAVADGMAYAHERGRADPLLEDIVEDAARCKESGAWKVVLGSWIVVANRVFQTEVADAVARRVDLKDVIWALPALNLGGVPRGSFQHHTHEIRDMEFDLVHFFGADVNITNLSSDWVPPFEALRRGVGANSRLLTLENGVEPTGSVPNTSRGPRRQRSS